MANKRNQPKPGSRWRGIPSKIHPDEKTFRDQCEDLKQSDKNPAKADRSDQATVKWGQKFKVNFQYTYSGNEEQSRLLPMKQRKANLLKFLQTVNHDIMVLEIEPAVLKSLIKDGDVYIENGKSGHIRQSHSFAKATDPIERPEFKEAVEEEEPKVVKKTIMWNKRRDQKLLMDIIMGTADQDLINAVGKTKTKMRKIAK